MTDELIPPREEFLKNKFKEKDPLDVLKQYHDESWNFRDAIDAVRLQRAEFESEITHLEGLHENSEKECDNLRVEIRSAVDRAMESDRISVAAEGKNTRLQAQVRTLALLVRIGFLVTVGGERATSDIVRDPETLKLLMAILQAKDADAAGLVAVEMATDEEG